MCKSMQNKRITRKKLKENENEEERQTRLALDFSQFLSSCTKYPFFTSPTRWAPSS